MFHGTPWESCFCLSSHHVTYPSFCTVTFILLCWTLRKYYSAHRIFAKHQPFINFQVVSEVRSYLQISSFWFQIKQVYVHGFRHIYKLCSWSQGRFVLFTHSISRSIQKGCHVSCTASCPSSASGPAEQFVGDFHRKSEVKQRQTGYWWLLNVLIEKAYSSLPLRFRWCTFKTVYIFSQAERMFSIYLLADSSSDNIAWLVLHWGEKDAWLMLVDVQGRPAEVGYWPSFTKLIHWERHTGFICMKCSDFFFPKFVFIVLFFPCKPNCPVIPASRISWHMLAYYVKSVDLKWCLCNKPT